MGWDIVAIGTNHNLPVEDPIKTAEIVSSLVDGPISVGYYESWAFHPKSKSIIIPNEYKWIEIERIGSLKSGTTTFFSIEKYCERKIYSELKDTINDIVFADEKERNYFLMSATEKNFALYECDCKTKPFFDLRIFNEIVEFHCDFRGRWFQFVRAFKSSDVLSNKVDISDFRKYIFRQLKACGCDKAYYFADQGSGEWLYNAIDKSAKEWIEYLEKGEYITDGNPEIVKVQNLLDNTLMFSEVDDIDCFVDDCSDLEENK